MAGPLNIRPQAGAKWDCVALGEVMLRLDPGAGRVRTARSFQVWEGGGEYNVARALKKCFGLSASVVTALPKNDLGWLVEDFIGQGGVDTSHILWRDFDGLGRNTRVGLNFTERGFGLRPPLGCVDRANSAASQMRPGEVDWDRLFGAEGVRWFHTGGIFAALSPGTAQMVIEAVEAARRHGVIVSYDVNYRASLWNALGDRAAVQKITRAIAQKVDVMIGHAADFAPCFGVEGIDLGDAPNSPDAFRRAMPAILRAFPNFKVVATPLREAESATRNDWSAILYADGAFHQPPLRRHLEIYDRVGGGDGFASGLIYAFLAGKDAQGAVEYGAAHGALAMTTPGDTSMANLAEVEAVVKGAGARAIR
jgi:2-dehydro-3-deoxygluconokinase